MIHDWKQKYASKVITTEEAAAKVKNGDRIYLGSMCSEPTVIIKSLGESYLEDVEMIQFISGSAASELTLERPQAVPNEDLFRGRQKPPAGQTFRGGLRAAISFADP